MTLLPSNPGQLVALVGDTMQLPSLIGTDPPISFFNQNSIITQLGFAVQTSQQFMHTIGGDIYTYVFGDRIGQMQLGGLAAAQPFNGGVVHGIEQMLYWYGVNKISYRGGPISLLLGRRTVLSGYVIGFRGKLWRPEEMMIQFELDLALLPNG